MKQANVRLNVIVEIRDEQENPDGSKTVPLRIHANFKNTLKDMIKESKDRYSKGFDDLLDRYVDLCILGAAGVPFTPLTTEEALKLEECTIEEVRNDS